MFVSDKQRKHVMGMMSKVDRQINKIRASSDIPMVVGGDTFDDLQRQYDKHMLQFEREEKKLKRDIIEEQKNMFSDKSRGSVPLLETTFVIRGGTPRERQNVKKILDIIGTEPALKDFNTVRILEDLEQPVVFEDEKTIAVRDTTLHTKGEAIPAELAVMILSMAYKFKSPQASDESAAMYAKKVVYSAIDEMTERMRRKQELESIEVYQAGAEVQPRYDVTPAEESSPVQVAVFPAEQEPETDTQGQVRSDTGQETKDKMLEAEKQSIYYSGGI